MSGCSNPPLLICPNLICSLGTAGVNILFAISICVRRKKKKTAELRHQHRAACVLGWLIRMSDFCQRSYQLNFRFVFLAARVRQPRCLFYYSSVSACRSPSLRSTLDNILRLRREDWPRWKFLLEISTIPAAYGHMLKLHLSHHSHSTLSSIKLPTPPTLEEGSKHDCNYNQTHTLCSVACCPSLNARVPTRRRLHPFSACPRLILWCSISTTQ